MALMRDLDTGGWKEVEIPKHAGKVRDCPLDQRQGEWVPLDTAQPDKRGWYLVLIYVMGYLQEAMGHFSPDLHQKWVTTYFPDKILAWYKPSPREIELEDAYRKELEND